MEEIQPIGYIREVLIVYRPSLMGRRYLNHAEYKIKEVPNSNEILVEEVLEKPAPARRPVSEFFEKASEPEKIALYKKVGEATNKDQKEKFEINSKNAEKVIGNVKKILKNPAILTTAPADNLKGNTTDKVRELYDQGKTRKEIGKIVGITGATVAYHIGKIKKMQEKEPSENSDKKRVIGSILRAAKKSEDEMDEEEEKLAAERKDMQEWRNNETYLKPLIIKEWDRGKGLTPKAISEKLHCSLFVVDKIIDALDQEAEDEPDFDEVGEDD